LTNTQAVCTLIEDQLNSWADSYAVNENNTLSVAAPGVLANDWASEGNSFSALLVTGPKNGTVTLNADGSFTYTPDANFWGFDVFTYEDSLGTLLSTPAQVQLQIQHVNFAPVANNDAYTINQGQQLNLSSVSGVTSLYLNSQP